MMGNELATVSASTGTYLPLEVVDRNNFAAGKEEHSIYDPI